MKARYRRRLGVVISYKWGREASVNMLHIRYERAVYSLCTHFMYAVKEPLLTLNVRYRLRDEGREEVLNLLYLRSVNKKIASLIYIYGYRVSLCKKLKNS